MTVRATKEITPHVRPWGRSLTLDLIDDGVIVVRSVTIDDGGWPVTSTIMLDEREALALACSLIGFVTDNAL